MVSRALVLPPPIGSSSSSSSSSSKNQAYYRRRLEVLSKQPDYLFVAEPECIVSAPDWSVFSSGLLLRCRAEFHRVKTVERAVLQLHALREQLDGTETLNPKPYIPQLHRLLRNNNLPKALMFTRLR